MSHEKHLWKPYNHWHQGSFERLEKARTRIISQDSCHVSMELDGPSIWLYINKENEILKILESRWKRSQCLIPFPIMIFLITTYFEALTWTPSVLGLRAGARTLRWFAATLVHFLNFICIYWLFSTFRFLTIRLLHNSNVIAWKNQIFQNVSPFRLMHNPDDLTFQGHKYT